MRLQDVMEVSAQGFNLPESSVHLLQSAEGQNTGEGYVEFHSPAEAASAMAKDHAKIGSRYVELFACTRRRPPRVWPRPLLS